MSLPRQKTKRKEEFHETVGNFFCYGEEDIEGLFLFR